MKKHLVLLFLGLIFSSLQAQEIEEIQQLFANDAAIEDYFGSAVSISGDFAIIGSCYDDDNGADAGAAYIFDNNSGVWEQTAKLIASDGESNDFFALAVSISGDYAFIGAVGDDSYTGSVYVFHHNSGAWTQTAKLTASDATAADFFGYSVGVDGDYAVIGAFGDDLVGESSGSAYVFYNNSGSWEQQAKIFPSDGANQDQFGSTVAISGNNIIVGASFKDDDGTNSGAAYAFQNNSGTWSQTAKLLANDASGYSYFGDAVAIYNDWAIIGAYSNSPNGIIGGGAAYTYYNNSGVWEQQSKLIAPDAQDHSWFGSSVSISEDYIIIGAEGEIFYTPYVEGSAYIYHNTSNTWTLAANLSASDIGTEDQFGYAVGVFGDFALVGSPRNDSNAEDAGRAYIYCSASPHITIQPEPYIGALLGENVVIAVEAEGSNLSYQWRQDEVELSDGGNLSGTNTNELVISNVTENHIGNYDCVIIGDCGLVISENSYLDIILGINDIENNISISPQPAHHKLLLVSSYQDQYKIYDNTGRIVLYGDIKLGKNQLDISALQSGIYYLQMKSEDTKKLIVE